MSHSATAAIPAIPTTVTRRYVFIDALRGVASFGVLLLHLLHDSPMELTLRRALPKFLLGLCESVPAATALIIVLATAICIYVVRIRDWLSGWGERFCVAIPWAYLLPPSFFCVVRHAAWRVQSDWTAPTHGGSVVRPRWIGRCCRSTPDFSKNGVAWHEVCLQTQAERASS